MFVSLGAERGVAYFEYVTARVKSTNISFKIIFKLGRSLCATYICAKMGCTFTESLVSVRLVIELLQCNWIPLLALKV